MIAPIDYTSQAANMFNQGVSSGLGMQRASMLRQEQEAQAAAREKQQTFNKSLQTAWDSGDNKQMIDLIAANPEQMQAIQGMLGIRDQQQKTNIANVAQQLNAAITSGNMQGAAGVINSNAEFLSSIGQDPQELLGDLQSDPQSLLRGAESMMLMTMAPEDVMKYKQKLEDQAIDRERIAASRYATDVSARNARERSAGKSGSTPGERTVVLGDGRTVTISGKLHGAGANAFYEGVDANGQTVRVPAQAIAAPSTSASSAENYAMKKDIDSILSAKDDDLGFITGVTGGLGTNAIGADIRSRIKGGEQRNIYNASMRIQGRMQKQGVASARDMGASGINTAAEAKMYFQGMPQIDFSSPETMKQSIAGIKEYTDNYNRQYNVNLQGGDNQQSTQGTMAQGGSATDLQPTNQGQTGIDVKAMSNDDLMKIAFGGQ
ncbi:MAG: phage DNA ejection protein [Aeromonas veronii]